MLSIDAPGDFSFEISHLFRNKFDISKQVRYFEICDLFWNKRLISRKSYFEISLLADSDRSKISNLPVSNPSNPEQSLLSGWLWLLKN
jgi:hypothetical protein